MINRGADTSYDYFKGVKLAPISDGDREIIRRYAVKVKELSLRDREMKKRKLWYDHNALKTKEPVILCDPEHGWYEIILESELDCQGELARKIEWVLKREIFWGEEMGDDRPIEATFSVPMLYKETGWGFEAVEAQNNGSGAYHIDQQMESYEQISQLKYNETVIDHEGSKLLLELVEDLLGDILEVKHSTKWWWSLAMKRGTSDTFAFLRGMENMMMDMYLEPDNFKKVMQFITEGNLRFLDYVESEGLLTPNNDGTYVCSGGLGYSDELSPDSAATRMMDMWGFSESQMTSDVSPDMFEEFIFPYQLPMMERFGLNGYGCCEGLNNKWHIIQKIPRLRRVSVSNWAEHEVMSDQLRDKYIFSSKPNPAPLAVPKMDETIVKKWAENEARLTRDNVPEIIMKDNHTLGGNPMNAVRWCQIMQAAFKG